MFDETEIPSPDVNHIISNLMSELIKMEGRAVCADCRVSKTHKVHVDIVREPGGENGNRRLRDHIPASLSSRVNEWISCHCKAPF